MKNKKILIIIITVIVLLLCVLFLLTGNKRTDVYLKDYEVSSDGKVITLKVGVSSSAGYIRKMKQTSGSMNYYLTFYSTFGINSKLGAKDTYVLEINSNADAIYFYTGNKGYKQVLQKNDNGEWIKVVENKDDNILKKLSTTTKIVIKNTRTNETQNIIKDESKIKEIIDIISHASEKTTPTISTEENYQFKMYDINNELIDILIIWGAGTIGIESQDYIIPIEDTIRLKEIIEI